MTIDFLFFIPAIFMSILFLGILILFIRQRVSARKLDKAIELSESVLRRHNDMERGKGFDEDSET